MRILVLGGTQFLGRHFADLAVAGGHDVTVFHRGKTAPGSVAGATEILGDRDGGLGVLGDASWDVAVDTSGYLPRVVRASAELLKNRVDHYQFISTISVYRDFSRPGPTEAAETIVLDDPTTEEIGPNYGGLKTLCERAVLDVFPDRSSIIRPGLIVGPLDPTDRFTYWPMRLVRRGPVLLPGRPDQPVQLIDGRDLAAFMLRLAEGRVRGVYNATGPNAPMSYEDMIGGTMRALHRRPRLEWVDDGFLLEHGVGEWMDLPLWMAERSHMAGLLTADIGPAVAAGLTFRPFANTVWDTSAWAEAEGRWRRRGAGLKASKEREVLTAWRARDKAAAAR